MCPQKGQSSFRQCSTCSLCKVQALKPNNQRHKSMKVQRKVAGVFIPQWWLMNTNPNLERKHGISQSESTLPTRADSGFFGEMLDSCNSRQGAQDNCFRYYLKCAYQWAGRGKINATCEWIWPACMNALHRTRKTIRKIKKVYPFKNTMHHLESDLKATNDKLAVY